MRRLLACALALTAPAAFAFTADELAAKNVEAKGGLEKVHAIRSLRLAGTLRLQNDALQLSYVELISQPGCIRYEASLQGLTQIQAYDGAQAWQINPFQGRKDAEKLSADDAKGMAEDAADFAGPLVDYRQKGYRLELLGTEDIDGTEAYKLRVSRANGDLTTVYLDPDYFLEVRTINRRIEHGVPVETVTDYGDYEKVADVFLPFFQITGAKGSSERQKVQFSKGEANLNTDGSQFRFPVGQVQSAK